MKIEDLITMLQDLQKKGFTKVGMSQDPEGNGYYEAGGAWPIWDESMLEEGYEEDDRPQEEFLTTAIIWPGCHIEPWGD